jgi:hypothetical protein
MGIKYYLKAPVSEYTDKDGQQKKRYQTIGIVTETKKGDLMAKIEMIPLLGMKEGAFWCYLNVPEDKDDSKPAYKPSTGLADLESDIPF